MLRFASSVAVLAAVGVVLAGGSPAAGEKHAKPFPQVIQLPTGFRPEGIEVGRGTTFYVGSVASGAIYRGDLRTGSGVDPSSPGASGKAATGIELDSHNRLFVAGAGTGNAYVYDATTGAPIRTYSFATPVTPRRRSSTTSSSRTTPRTSPTRGRRCSTRFRSGRAERSAMRRRSTSAVEYAHVAGQFNLNGIDATANGKTLIAVQTAGGKLYRIDPSTGVASGSTLAAGESVPTGDGILLYGQDVLDVVQNQLNRVAVIALRADLAAGRVRHAAQAIPTSRSRRRSTTWAGACTR